MDRNHEEAGKASNSRFSAELVNFGKYFSRVGDCENQGGIDRRIERQAVRSDRSPLEENASVPTFFHGSTVVRTSVLGGYFTKISGYVLFDLGFRCDNQKHGYFV